MTPSEAYVRNLVEVAADIWHVSPEDVFGRSRARRFTDVRFATWLVLRDHSRRWTWYEIARHFGRDHSTVISGVLKARQRRREDADFAYLVREVSAHA